MFTSPISLFLSFSLLSFGFLILMAFTVGIRFFLIKFLPAFLENKQMANFISICILFIGAMCIGSLPNAPQPMSDNFIHALFEHPIPVLLLIAVPLFILLNVVDVVKRSQYRRPIYLAVVVMYLLIISCFALFLYYSIRNRQMSYGNDVIDVPVEPTTATISQGFSKIPYSVSQKAQQIQTAYDQGVHDFSQFSDSITVTRDGMLNLQIYSKDSISPQNETELKTITAYYPVGISSLHVREADIWIPYNRLKELGDLEWLSSVKPTSPGPQP